MIGLSRVKIMSKARCDRPCGCSVSSCSRIRSTTLTNRIFNSGRFRLSRSTAASPSSVGTSPAVAMTTSGSSPRTSVPAHSQIPRPRVQCAIACSMVRKFGLGCFPATTTLTYWRETQAVVVGGQQGVGVRRQIDPHHLGALVDHVVDEPRILMAEPVVVLAPDMAGQQVIEAGDRPSPRNVVGDLEPLGVLVDHRVDDVDEGLVAVEQPVPPGQQVALEPALALVLGEHLHHPARAGQVLVDLGREELGVPLLGGHVEDGLQPVRRRLVGPEDAEVVRVEPHHVGQPPAQHPGGLRDRRPGAGTSTAYSRKSGSRRS